MKVFLKILAWLIFLVIGGLFMFLMSNYKIPRGKPIPTNEEKMKQVNTYVNSSLIASDNNMYLQIDSVHKLYMPSEFPELKDIVNDLNHSIKIKEVIYSPDANTHEVIKSMEVCLRWSDTEIYIDISSDVPNNQIYIQNRGTYFKAEASAESIRKVAEFVAKVK